MPPASPETTLAWRSASSSEVLPWSTWPITVTTGERGSVSVESSTMSNRPSSTSEAATRLTVWPSSSAISCAVSASITSVILCIAPCFISSRITSTARSDMRLASSWMLMASGITTSRISFSFGSFDCMPLQALGAAAERSDRALAHVIGIERGDQRQAAALLRRRRLGGGFRRLRRGEPRRRGRGGSVAGLRPRRWYRRRRRARAPSAARPARGGAGVAALASASPKRFLASSSALRLASSSCR